MVYQELRNELVDKGYTVRCFMRMTGLEPARRGHQNLNLARLPIPPHPQDRL